MHNVEEFTRDMLLTEQYRMRRLQVFNWGTFSGLHDIPVAADGFLIVGRSGSGKSTLLDALSALLVPPPWLGFNAAAREGDRGRYDRNLVSYIRGAWADQKDVDSGQIATQFLRADSTWSALMVEYANQAGQVVSLIQLYWLRGTTTRSADVKRHYMLAERPFDVMQELADFKLDIRKLKQQLDDVYHNDKFRPYSERFRRLLGIDSEMALKLLHKTQSAKNLGDLNHFLREFMLDKPETFAVAERLVEEFDELDAAHQSVVIAREQVETLQPAREKHQRLTEVLQEGNQLDELIASVDAYRDERKAVLLEEELSRLHTEDQSLEGQEQRQGENLENLKTQLANLERDHREQGGGRIEQIEQEKRQSEQQRDERLAKRTQAQQACEQLSWVLPDSPQAYAELAGRARDYVDSWQKKSEALRDRQFQLLQQKKDTETEFVEVRKEIDAMQRQPSNIPAHMLELRVRLTDALGLLDEDLPFVGELIEVREEDVLWSGAIERVLHGFALSLLVDERHYAAVTTYVNDTRLKQRLVYHRLTAKSHTRSATIHNNSLIYKLQLKETACRAWLDAELKARFNYACVESLHAFRDSDRAITREGQIKHGKSRHEKDDRRAIEDRRHWVLGFDNREKLGLFQNRAQHLADEISQFDQQITQLKNEETQHRDHFKACHTLANLRWQELDVAPLLVRIHELEKALKELRQGNSTLQKLGEKIEKQKQKIISADNTWSTIKAKRINIKNQLHQHQEELNELQILIKTLTLTPFQSEGLEARFSALEQTLTLKNLEQQRTRVERNLNGERRTLQEEANTLEKNIERIFASFKNTWPQDGADMDASLASAPEFLAKLQRLEHDGLPAFEQRFFEMLQEQSTENLAALNTHLRQARKDIRDRMELVNESLSGADFSPGTHLQIVVNDRQLDSVTDFQRQIQQVLDNAWGTDRALAEERFAVMRSLVNQLSGQDSEQQRWREQVLDVRQHVDFVGYEYDAEGDEVEVYRSGAGKSGGQREKLATTCLAAALRYQLGGSDGGLPMYAPVVLDEAFGKADNEFTELAMKIFTNFGFQMIVATPLKSVMTLEPFIGGACFVDIAERKRSATLQIEYDQQARKLDLPDTLSGTLRDTLQDNILRDSKAHGENLPA